MKEGDIAKHGNNFLTVSQDDVGRLLKVCPLIMPPIMFLGVGLNVHCPRLVQAVVKPPYGIGTPHSSWYSLAGCPVVCSLLLAVLILVFAEY